MLTIKSAETMLKGESVEIQETTLIVPPFNIERQKETIGDRDVFREISENTKPNFDTAAALDASVHWVFVALRPNYPDITEKFIAEHFSIHDMNDVIAASNRANLGGRKPTAGEAQSPKVPAIGIDSQQASVRRLDGLGDASKPI